MANSRTTAGKRQVAESLFRHKKKTLSLALVAFLLGTAAIYFFPRKYRSEAKLYLQVGRESVGVDPLATTGQTVNLMRNGRDEEVKTAIDVIQSRGLISKVVEQLGAKVVLGEESLSTAESKAEEEPNVIVGWGRGFVASTIGLARSIDPVSSEEDALIRIEKNLRVHSQQDSTVLVLSYDAQSPRLAQAVLDTVVEVYQEEHQRIHRNQKSSVFFDDQMKILEDRLADAMVKLRDAKVQRNLVSVEGRAATLEGQLNNIEADRQATEQDYATAKGSMRDLANQLTVTPERLVAEQKSIPNQGADRLREQLYQLQVRKIELEARYNNSHPLVKAIDQQVKQAEMIVNKQASERTEKTDDVNPIHRELMLDFKKRQSAVAGYEGRLETLTRQKVAVLESLAQLNADEVPLLEMQREVDLARGKVMQYANNAEQARIEKASEVNDVSNVSVVQDATLSEKPVSPSKGLIGLATILFCTAGPVALALGLERSDDRIKRESDLEDLLDLPVLASTPDSSLHSRLLPTTGVVHED